MDGFPFSPTGDDLELPERATSVSVIGLRHSTAMLALAAGALTLIGIATGIDPLIRWAPSSTSMNPIAAAMLILGAIAVIAPAWWPPRASSVVAGTMVATGGAKIVQLALGRPLGIDQLVSSWLKAPTAMLPDPVAPNSAVALVLLGIALGFGRTKKESHAIGVQICCAATLIIAILALIGFALGATTINQFTFNRMACNAAVGLTALALAIISLSPDHGIMRLLLFNGRSGDLARKALPICLVVPVLFGATRLWAQHLIGFSTGDGVVIMIVGNIALSLGLLWGCLILLLRSDAELHVKAQAVAESEERYRLTSRVGQMGHWRYDSASRAVSWSDEFRAVLRVPEDVMPSLDVMNDCIHPDDREAAMKKMEQALSNGVGWNWQLRLLQPDGSIKYVKSHGICTRRPDGSLDSLFGVLADITELELARQAAEAATEAQAAFLANMSHEIRTPLNGVLGFISLLLDSKLDSTQRRYLSLVNESAQVLLKLLNDILDLSKVQAGHIEIAPAATDLRRIIDHAVRLMAPLAEQKAIELKVVIAPDFPDAAMIDGSRFRQILLNVLGNALKFTDHGSVTVRLEVEPMSDGTASLRATVADTGVGIPRDRQDMVFNPFVQADSSTSRRFGGTGLGLSISRQLAELMGGTLTLDSIEGAGTTVELALPLLPAVAGADDGHDAAAYPVNGGDEGFGRLVDDVRARPGKSILLVEDLELNRELVGEMLRRLGHRVEFAVNGAEAVVMAARLDTDPAHWDMIFMDVQMPVMNGTDATRAIRARGGAAATIPIIALSANAFDSEIEESRRAGMNAHVVKPIDFQLLRRTIDQWGAPTGRPRRDAGAQSRHLPPRSDPQARVVSQ